jgi:putative CocE/NonD family hydrolase
MLKQHQAVTPGSATLPLSQADERILGRRVDFYQDWLTHEQPGDPWWDVVDFRSERDQAPPATFLGGWYDIFLPAQIEDYTAVRAAGGDARMTIGPWTHASPAGMAASLREALTWFDRHSDAAPSAVSAPNRVRLFVMGSRRWVDVPDWPPPATVERWHLQPGGRLSTDPPTESKPDGFRFDPADPTPGIGGPSLDLRNAGRKDQRHREERPDVLTYTSPRMDREMTVAGPLAVELWFRSSRPYTDVSVRLCCVSANGRSVNLSDGYRRLRPEDVTPDADGILHVRVDMWPTATTFRRGEAIRLQVASGAHPLFARNLGTGEPVATGSTMRAASQEVFHDPGHPSAVELPVSPI